MRVIVLGLLTVLLSVACAGASAPEAPEPLTVWLMVHSHDDVGWLKTVDDYYTNNVHFIISSVANELTINPDRKFLQVEQAFMSRYWNSVGDKKKTQIRNLVKNGQLTFSLGGYVMPDEANPTMFELIETLTEGSEFLLREFNVAPVVAEQIDPFGQSPAVAALYHMAGFEFYVINRIDFRLKSQWSASQHLEFNWKGLFTHVLDNHYSYPFGLTDIEWGFYGNGVSILPTDVSEITTANVLFYADLFYSQVVERSKYFKTPHVLIPWGNDFTAQNSMMVYEQLETIMDFIHANPTRYNNTVLKYSNLLDYYQATQKYGIEWDNFEDDFFPYADNSRSYWTGYFTSHPALKLQVRLVEGYMRNFESVLALASLGNKLRTPVQNFFANVSLLRTAFATAIHHDAVAGTSKAAVADDYSQRLNDGVEFSLPIASSSLQSLLAKSSGKQLATFASQLSDVAVQQYLASGEILPVVVTNSLGHSRTVPVEIPLINMTGVSANVQDSLGSVLSSQLTVYPNGTVSVSFLAAVPALGASTYFVQVSNGGQAGSVVRAQAVDASTSAVLENEFFKYDASVGMLLSKIDGISSKLSFELRSFNASEDDVQPAGAYIFRPAATSSDPLCQADQPAGVRVSFIQGSVFDMLIMNATACVGYNAVIYTRLWKGITDAVAGSFVDLQVLVGPVSVPFSGKEVFFFVVSDLLNKGVFSTDDNNYLDMQRLRNLDGRPGDADSGVALAGNIYPAVSRVSIADSSLGTTLTVVSHSAHGVASFAEGEMNILIHRRLRKDDYRGVNEALEDTTIVCHPFRLLLSSAAKKALAVHTHYEDLNFDAAMWPALLTKPLSSPKDWSMFYNAVFSPIQTEMPPNVQLMTFKIRSASVGQDRQLVFRIWHPFADGEDAEYSVPVTFDVGAWISATGLRVVKADEVTVFLNRVIRANLPPADIKVTLKPKDIKSFIVTVQ
eukprot:ANDGO_04366.mRNA.1 Lysosomal alpha-mannosidase